MFPRTREPILAAVAVVLLAGCAGLPSRDALNPFRDRLELSLERPSDLMPPEGLRVTANDERAIGLAWDPVLVGDVAGYAVLRARDPAEPFGLVGHTTARFGTVYHDRGEGEAQLGDGQTYHYHVHPFDSQGRVSRSHAHISATTELPPDVPAGLRAYSNLPRRVVLAWDPSQRLSTTGYVVMRSPTVAGPWERVGRLEARLATVYEDPVPGDLRVMYYRVVALNRFGGESEQTEPVRAVTKAEPLAPVGLEVEARALGRVSIRWTANVEKDLRGYEVWRATRDGETWTGERRLAQVDAPATHFEDAEVECGQEVRYWLRALDADGLTSRDSKRLTTRGESIGLELVSGGDDPPRLRWDEERAAGFPLIEILEVRTARPDRELARLVGGHEASLPELAPGKRRLAVLLREGAEGAVRRCELHADVR